MTRQIALSALFTLSLAACNEDTEGGDEGASADRVTYYEDVLPILARNCNTCHTEGEVAPFPLDDYDSAAQYAPLIAVAVQERTMPPYGVNNDGSCNTFVDAQWLTEEEIDLITQWVDDGAEEGDPETPRPDVRTPNELRGNNIVEIGIPEGYVPVPEEYAGGETEDYQCFLAMEPAAADQFLIGFDVVPDNTALVHHVIAFEVNPSFLGNGSTMAALDADSPDQAGWKCTGAAGDGVIPEGVPIAWAPGTGAVNFPDGTGIKIEQGNVLVVQMHYDLSGGKTGTDSTTVNLDFADSVEREARQTLSDPFLYGAVLGNPDQLPPGQEHAQYEWSMTIADATFESTAEGEVEIYGMLPHMHKRGNSMTVEFGSAANGMQCGANIDRWDFDWQRLYFLETPIQANYQDEIRVTCDYDTSRDSAPVLPGFGTEDEMCLVGLYIVPK